MKLHNAITQYVTYQKSLGNQFLSSEHVLKYFVRSMGHDRDLSDIQSKEVATFLAGKAAITNTWHMKYYALLGFYRYMISRGHIKESPLPTIIPKRGPYVVPYIYKVQELQALLDASLSYQKNFSLFDPYMIRTLLLLLYGTGLRISEAIKLTLADVDWPQALITIRETKFNKTRLVPMGVELIQSLSQYVSQRHRDSHSQNPESPFFVGRNGKAINRGSFQAIFARIRKKAGVRRTDTKRFQPRLHDLRHTFAVHRLTQWYREGADVQKWLPVLSVYLGHAHLDGTAVYLTMTPALLEEAGSRFQHYAFKEESHA